jgi:hypothetical protein
MKRLKLQAHNNSVEILHRFVKLGADATREVIFELSSDWDGMFCIDPKIMKGARIKPVVFVPEEIVAQVDRHALRQSIIEAGAVYCKVPTVHISRKKITRDERHDVSLSLEESLEIFAEETSPEDADKLISFAAKVARDADEGDEE